MKKTLAAAMLAMGLAQTALAADDVVMLPLQNVVEMGIAQGKLDGSVKFYLSGAATPRVASRMGDGVSNKKTNGFAKDSTTSCQWAALSALIAFEASAKKNGANAVVDLHSYYKKNTVKDAVNFECHVGAIMSGVTLKGTYAKTR